VSDLECIIGCRRLVAREGILAGGSSGAAVMAVERLRARLGAGATCVAVFPDRGERYLDTIYSDAWVAEHFGLDFGLPRREVDGERDTPGRNFGGDENAVAAS
ncbi:MAG: hypothetical protein ABIR79_02485, partial [Candidatus Binatia bacterium]